MKPRTKVNPAAADYSSVGASVGIVRTGFGRGERPKTSGSSEDMGRARLRAGSSDAGSPDSTGVLSASASSDAVGPVASTSRSAGDDKVRGRREGRLATSPSRDSSDVEARSRARPDFP